jgi:hypothetical protein
LQYNLTPDVIVAERNASCKQYMRVLQAKIREFPYCWGPHFAKK